MISKWGRVGGQVPRNRPRKAPVACPAVGKMRKCKKPMLGHGRILLKSAC